MLLGETPPACNCLRTSLTQVYLGRQVPGGDHQQIPANILQILHLSLVGRSGGQRPGGRCIPPAEMPTLSALGPTLGPWPLQVEM